MPLKKPGLKLIKINYIHIRDDLKYLLRLNAT
jgi:hypothetical protein